MSQFEAKPLTSPPTPGSNNGTINVQFTYVDVEGKPKRYRFQLGGKYGEPIAMSLAKEVCERIYRDTQTGDFDFDLRRYKRVVERTLLDRKRVEDREKEREEILKEHQQLIEDGKKTRTNNTYAKRLKLLEKRTEELERERQAKEQHENPYILPLWDEWVKSLQKPAHTVEKHYDAIRAMMVRNGNTPRLRDLTWFTEAGLKHTTFNQRRSYLVNFEEWLEEEKGITPKFNLQSRKAEEFEEEEEPFTREEMRLILEAFRKDTFCPKKSAFKHSHYADYVEVSMLTANRPQETIGLRVKDVDFEHKRVTIRTVLARQNKGARKRKETKNGEIKVLPLEEGRLLEILRARIPEDAKPDDLVFPGTKGKPIDDTNFRDRQWIPILEGLGIKYRRFYNIRHSVLTLVVKETGNLMEAAKLAGHKNLRMVQERYGHLVGDIKLFKL